MKEPGTDRVACFRLSVSEEKMKRQTSKGKNKEGGQTGKTITRRACYPVFFFPLVTHPFAFSSQPESLE